MKKEDATTEYYRNYPACPTTGKLSLPSRKIPDGMRLYRRRGGRTKPSALVAYKCPDCPYWHLTKNKPKRLLTLKNPVVDYVGRPKPKGRRSRKKKTP